MERGRGCEDFQRLRFTSLYDVQNVTNSENFMYSLGTVREEEWKFQRAVCARAAFASHFHRRAFTRIKPLRRLRTMRQM